MPRSESQVVFCKYILASFINHYFEDIDITEAE